MRYAVALTLTVVAAVGILVSFVTVVGGALLTQELASRIGFGDQTYAILQVLRWPAVFAVVTVAVAILYRYAPNVVVPWRWVLFGSALFALAWLGATAVVGFYAANFANFGATYGSLGGVIVLMLWFYVTALVLLLGAEVSAAAARTWNPEAIHGRREEREAADRIGDTTEAVKDRVRDAAEDAGAPRPPDDEPDRRSAHRVRRT
jgi:membrane protein